MSQAFGLTDAEIDRLEKDDPSAESLIIGGWWMYHHRTAHWAVAMGGALVGEGEKRNPVVREALLREIEELRQAYTAMGVENVEQALISKTVHSGVDVDHANFDADVIRDYVTTRRCSRRCARRSSSPSRRSSAASCESPAARGQAGQTYDVVWSDRMASGGPGCGPRACPDSRCAAASVRRGCRPRTR